MASLDTMKPYIIALKLKPRTPPMFRQTLTRVCKSSWLPVNMQHRLRTLIHAATALRPCGLIYTRYYTLDYLLVVLFPLSSLHFKHSDISLSDKFFSTDSSRLEHFETRRYYAVQQRRSHFSFVEAGLLQLLGNERHCKNGTLLPTYASTQPPSLLTATMEERKVYARVCHIHMMSPESQGFANERGR